MAVLYKISSMDGGHMSGSENLNNTTTDCPICPRCQKSKNVKKNPLREIVGRKKIPSIGYIKKFYCSGCGHDFNTRKPR